MALALLALLRPLNLAAIWLATDAGARLAGGSGWTPLSFVPLLVAAFGYARNDAADWESDRLNHALRPIPAGRLSRGAANVAAGVALVLALAALLAGAPSPRLVVTFAAFVALLYLYSPRLKDRGALGPATVAAVSALAVLWGGALGTHPERAQTAALLAGLAIFARECAKELEDLPGDEAAGRGTWPVRDGAGRVRLALRLASAGALVLLPFPWLRKEAGLVYALIAGLVSVPLLAWTSVRVPADPAAARMSSRAIKGAIFAGIVGLWLGARG